MGHSIEKTQDKQSIVIVIRAFQCTVNHVQERPMEDTRINVVSNRMLGLRQIKNEKLQKTCSVFRPTMKAM